MCKATAAEGTKVRYTSWTDGDGVDIVGNYSSSPDGEYVLTVDESKLAEPKVVFCIVSVKVDGQLLYEENDSYPVHVTGESCM